MIRHRLDDGIVALIIVGVAAVMISILIAVFFIASNTDDDKRNENDTQTNAVSDTVSIADTDTASANTDETTEMQTDASAGEESTDVLITEAGTTQPDVQIVYNEELLEKVSLPEAKMPEGYCDKLVFFGDSTTYGMKYYKVFGSFDTTQVWTPQSGTLALFRALTDAIYNPVIKEDQLLNDLCASVKPEYLIMTLGVNGIAFLDEESFKDEYQAVIYTILTNSPDTHLILQSIYPVASNSETLNSINNTRIQKANEWIVELAEENNLPYLNTYYALVGDDGWLPQEYQNGDGMHFNKVGFDAVMDYVLSHPYIP